MSHIAVPVAACWGTQASAPDPSLWNYLPTVLRSGSPAGAYLCSRQLNQVAKRYRQHLGKCPELPLGKHENVVEGRIVER